MPVRPYPQFSRFKLKRSSGCCVTENYNGGPSAYSGQVQDGIRCQRRLFPSTWSSGRFD